jgi:hypothetical protein
VAVEYSPGPWYSPVRSTDATDEARMYLSTNATRHYLHGDYLEPADRGPGNVVYCAFCDGYCLPQHLYDEHEIAENFVRLKAGKRGLDRARQRVERPIDAPNFLDGTPDPV